MSDKPPPSTRTILAMGVISTILGLTITGRLVVATAEDTVPTTPDYSPTDPSVSETTTTTIDESEWMSLDEYEATLDREAPSEESLFILTPQDVSKAQEMLDFGKPVGFWDYSEPNRPVTAWLFPEYAGEMETDTEFTISSCWLAIDGQFDYSWVQLDIDGVLVTCPFSMMATDEELAMATLSPSVGYLGEYPDLTVQSPPVLP